MSVVGLLLAAGASTRMGFNKLTLPLGGKNAITLSALALAKGGVERLVLVTSPDTVNAAVAAGEAAALPFMLAEGGETRQQSVLNGLLLAGEDCEIVAIHDAARCLVSPAIVQESIKSARAHDSGVTAISVPDTVLRETAGAVHPFPREELRLTQTPQTFRYGNILAAYHYAEENGFAATDDCSVLLSMGKSVRFVAGNPLNRKLTVPEDIPWFEAACALTEKKPVPDPAAVPPVAVGWGEDVHRLVPGRPLILGGVAIPYEKGLLGHSDADVLTHAVIDALLGAASAGDIGRLFPDSDPQYKDISSLTLLTRARDRLTPFAILHIDATIVAERPKLAPFVPEMEARLAGALGLTPASVNVKATTTEGTGPEGRGVCIRATAVVTLAAKQ